MADIDERPAKIRKVDEQAYGDVEPQFAKNTAEPATTTAPEAVPTNDNATLNGASKAPPSKKKPPTPPAIAAAVADAVAKANGEMSKSQQKKLKKKLEWEAGKESRKEYKKEKERAKKTKAEAEKQALIAAGVAPPVKPKAPKQPPSIQVPVTLLLDCDFDSYMLDKEIASLGQQVTRSYSDLKNGRYRAHMVISSFGGRMRERYEGILQNYHLAWKGVTFTDKLFTEAAKDAHERMMIGKEGGRLAGALAGKEQLAKDKGRDQMWQEKVAGEARKAEEAEEAGNEVPDVEASAPEVSTEAPAKSFLIPAQPQLVYLSSDSDETLGELQPYTTYIIGGIVDKNRHKRLCHKRAVELGIPTAKLPIGQYMEMQSRTVLATNHVVDIMVNWLESGDWGEAFLKAIPKRKEATLRKMKNNNAKNDGNREDEAQQDEEQDDEQEVDGPVEATTPVDSHAGDVNACDAQLNA